MSTDEKRAAVVREAMSWIGTPYHPCADVKGIGTDCAMLLVRIYQTIGIVAPDYDPRPYSMQWYLHRHAPLYLLGIQHHCHEITEAEALPGDIALYSFGRSPAHGAVLVDKDYVVHAYRPGGVVEIVERRALAARLHGYWSPF